MNKSAVEQFADSWLVISMNEQVVWDKWWSEAKNHDSAYPLAELLRDEWEELTEMVRVNNQQLLGEANSWRIHEQLANWGIEPFMIIARYLLGRVAEDRVILA